MEPDVSLDSGPEDVAQVYRGQMTKDLSSDSGILEAAGLSPLGSLHRTVSRHLDLIPKDSEKKISSSSQSLPNSGHRSETSHGRTDYFSDFLLTFVQLNSNYLSSSTFFLTKRGCKFPQQLQHIELKRSQEQ